MSGWQQRMTREPHSDDSSGSGRGGKISITFLRGNKCQKPTTAYWNWLIYRDLKYSPPDSPVGAFRMSFDTFYLALRFHGVPHGIDLEDPSGLRHVCFISSHLHSWLVVPWGHAGAGERGICDPLRVLAGPFCGRRRELVRLRAALH